MSTVLFYVCVYIPLAVILLMAGHIRAVKKRHAREVRNLVDECTTFRDRWKESTAMVSTYSALMKVDRAMLERLLKEQERLKDSTVDLLAELARIQNLASGARENLSKYTHELKLVMPIVSPVPLTHLQRAEDCLAQLLTDKT